METFFYLLPPALVGGTFTFIGLLKVYGFVRGIQGGGCKPIGQRLCGSCPSWSRSVNIGMTALFLLIGIGNLAWLMWIVWSWQN
jgi:hypothetical protein